MSDASGVVSALHTRQFLPEFRKRGGSWQKLSPVDSVSTLANNPFHRKMASSERIFLLFALCHWRTAVADSKSSGAHINPEPLTAFLPTKLFWDAFKCVSHGIIQGELGNGWQFA